MGREDKFVPEEPPPRIEPKQQVVVDKETRKIKRAGYCDFAKDGSFKPDVEEILVQGDDFDGTFHEDVSARDWHAEDGAFSPGEEKPAPLLRGPVLESPDGSHWELLVDDKGQFSAVKV